MENSNEITKIIISTINTLFDNMFNSIDNNLYSLLDKITFVGPSILKESNFEKIIGTSSTNGILLIANSILIAFILYYSTKYLLSHLTYSKIESPSSFIIKLILFGISMNFSFFIIEQILNINYNVTLAIQNLGSYLFNKNISFSELINTLNTKVYINTTSIDIFTLDGLLKSTLSFSLLSLVFSYSFRYVMIKIFVLLSPFAFLSLSLSSTSWFFKAWIRNFFSLLFVQIIVSLILLFLFSIDYSSNDILTKFIYIGGVFALIKVNSFIKEFIGGLSTDISQYVNTFMSHK